MSCYNLDHIIQECTEEKCKPTARGKTQGAKNEIYYEAWRSLNAWVELCFLKQQGAGISGFGCFGWELKTKDGSTQSRPVFIISDTFAKGYKIKRERVHHPPRLTHVQEVNFSLLAIKFSKVLTKDMVFSALRDIFKKIGDYILRGYEIGVEFGLGTLRCKERRLKFDFDQSKISNKLHLTDSGLFKYDEDLLNYIEPESEDLTDRSKARTAAKNALPHLNFKENNSGNDRDDVLEASNVLTPTDMYSRASLSGHAGPSPREKLSSRGTCEVEEETNIAKQTLDQDLRSILDSIHKSAMKTGKDSIREARKARVAEQAVMRSLDHVEHEARLDDDTLAEAAQQINDWACQQERNSVQRQKNKEGIMNALTSQMELHKKQMDYDKLENKSRIARFILPESAGVPPIPIGFSSTDGSAPAVFVQKHQLEQIKAKTEMAARQKRDAIEKEREYLKHLAVEIDMNNALHRSNHLEQQRALLEAWERDGHFRNLKKLQPCGVDAVRDYVQRNMTDADMSTVPANTTLGSALNMSIGYDARKGRI